MTWYVNIGYGISGNEELSKLLSEGWQIVSEHEEQMDSDGSSIRIVYSLTR